MTTATKTKLSGISRARAVANLEGATLITASLSDLHVIGVDGPADRSHPLYDERALLPPSKAVMDSLQAGGQQTPITVVKEGGLLIVVDGRQRVAAMRKLGWESCMCVVRDPESFKVTETQAQSTASALAVLVANVHVEDRPDHRAHKVKRLREMGLTNAEIGKAAGVTGQRVSQWLKWFDLTEAQQAAVLAGDKTFDAAISKKAPKSDEPKEPKEPKAPKVDEGAAALSELLAAVAAVLESVPAGEVPAGTPRLALAKLGEVYHKLVD